MYKSPATLVRSVIVGTFALSCLNLLAPAHLRAQAAATPTQVSQGSRSTRSRITGVINQGDLMTLKGHVLPILTRDRDLGMVEDAAPIRLYLNLQRTDAQQKDLDDLVSEQQNPASPNFHKWLTPEQFGERFGASAVDIDKITQWLSLQGFAVTSVAKNASTINFMATAGSVRNTFHAQLHYWNVEGGKHIATATDPQIPVALAGVVSGIAGLNQIPPHMHHTPIHSERYDAQTHKWYPVESANGTAAAEPHYNAGNGNYNMTPQDFYTIYNVNPTFSAGNRGAASTVAILGSGPFNYGTVTNGKAAGGDVATFRKLFGIKTPLNLLIESGSANFPCTVASGDDSGESALDVEWAGATAPGATLIFESCSGNPDGTGFNFLTEIQALVDSNVADVISSSIGFSESGMDASGNQAFDTAFAQAAAQGQTVLSAQGDSGSDDADFGNPQGTSGLTADYPGTSPLVLSIGGTDFQDKYDVDRGSSIPQSAYWSPTNSPFYGDALGYVPETTWNDSCASTLAASDSDLGGSPGESTATYCNSNSQYGQHTGSGGGGGISKIYAQPSWQKGIPGLSSSITKRATPDVSLFASTGSFWGHAIVVCDSGDPAGGKDCSSPDTFGFAGGTSFAAPQFAGILGLLKTATGSRQGLVQPALYALARTQYSAGIACYANGQTSNTGITTSLPVSACIFNDVTTSGNNNECLAGSLDCFTNSGATYGVLTSSGNTSTFIDGYAAGAKYDIATGLGSVNVTNLISKWNTAFSSMTSLKANPTTITTAQSTTLTATVTGGTPAGYTGAAPVLAGSVTFNLNGASLGSCNLTSGTCSIKVAASKLQIGSNSITATFTSTGAYPASTSTAITVTVNQAVQSQTITFGPLPNVTYPNPPNTVNLTASASSGLPVSYTVTGPATVSGSTLTVTGTGTIIVTASQAGNSSYSAATPVQQSFTSTAAIVAGTTVLSESVSLVNLGSTYQETVKITNSGTGTAQKVTLTTVTLGSASATQALPALVGNIAPGGFSTVVFTFPSTAGAPGTAAVAKFSGTYTGGNFSNSVRTTLPQSAQ